VNFFYEPRQGNDFLVCRRKLVDPTQDDRVPVAPGPASARGGAGPLTRPVVPPAFPGPGS